MGRTTSLADGPHQKWSAEVAARSAARGRAKAQAALTKRAAVVVRKAVARHCASVCVRNIFSERSSLRGHSGNALYTTSHELRQSASVFSLRATRQQVSLPVGGSHSSSASPSAFQELAFPLVLRHRDDEAAAAADAMKKFLFSNSLTTRTAHKHAHVKDGQNTRLTRLDETSNYLWGFFGGGERKGIVTMRR